jgi:hypothetical protein
MISSAIKLVILVVLWVVLWLVLPIPIREALLYGVEEACWAVHDTLRWLSQ